MAEKKRKYVPEKVDFFFEHYGCLSDEVAEEVAWEEYEFNYKPYRFIRRLRIAQKLVNEVCKKLNKPHKEIFTLIRDEWGDDFMYRCEETTAEDMILDWQYVGSI
jgi:hypothetical protein